MISQILCSHVQKFFAQNLPNQNPYILGFSGGVDSSALLSLILEAKISGCNVVHVDHGWRPESALEAEQLRSYVEGQGIPFFSRKLEPCPPHENAEDWSRNRRIEVFYEIAEQIGTVYVVLAHQANDQVEVVLKRIFEGSSVTKQRGMRLIEKKDSLVILRPLLAVDRSHLQEYLQERHIPYLNDPTNNDSAYLRARMRTSLIPTLELSFGKTIRKSILRVAEESAELEQFIEKELLRRFDLWQFPGGVFVSSNERDPFMIRALVEKVRAQLSLPSPSRSVVNNIVGQFCVKPQGISSFFVGPGLFVVEQGALLAFDRQREPIEEYECLGPKGSVFRNGWSISWEQSDGEIQKSAPSWRSLFAKKPVSWYIPANTFKVCPVSDRRLRGVHLQERATAPTLLRRFIPAIEQGFRLVVDPLSGYTVPLQPGRPCFKVTIERLFE